MMELVARLREVAPKWREGKSNGFAFNMTNLCLWELNALINEAADRIEQLEAADAQPPSHGDHND